MNGEESDYKAWKNKQNVWYKKLREPETDNLSKGISQTKYIKNDLLIQSCWLPG